jgi:hypothetical protein
MAWEWLAPAAAVAGAFVGGGTTWLVGRGARKHAEALADKKYDHDERMAQQGRQQKRLEDAYVELLTLMGRFRSWAFDGLNEHSSLDGVKATALTDAEISRVAALVRAYGSDAVFDAASDFWPLIGEVWSATLEQFSDEHPRGPELLGAIDAKRAEIGRLEPVPRITGRGRGARS